MSHELPLVDSTASRTPATTGTWRRRRRTRAQTTAAFNADTFRILKASQEPGRGLHGAAVPARRATDLLKLYGGMPAVESQQDAFLAGRLQADYTQTIDWKVAKEASTTPTCRTSRPTRRPTTRPSTSSPSSARSGSPRRAEPRLRRSPTSSRRCRPSGTRASLTHGRLTSVAAPRAARCPRGSRRWRGGGRAGATSSSRRGSSGSSLFTPFPMIATFVFTFTNINLDQAEPLRFVGLENYASAARRPAGLGLAAGHAQVRGPGAAGRGRPALRRRPAAPLPPPAGLGRLPGPVLPAVRRPVRGAAS